MADKNFTRRGNVRSDKNPFLEQALNSSKIAPANAHFRSDKRFTLTDRETGEITSVATHVARIYVDKTNFVKLYSAADEAIQRLSRAGLKMFNYLTQEVRKNPNTDQIYINAECISKEKGGISASTYFRGIKDLIDNKFIAESNKCSFYYLNISYIFNGDRNKFIKNNL